MRTFKSGASRDDNIGKLDFEGFLSPIVLKRYMEYAKDWKKILWAVGLFEGEGCISFSKVKGRIKKDGTRTKKKPYKYPQLTISSIDYDVLLKFKNIVKYGNIYQMKKKTIGGNILYQWKCSTQDEAFGVIFLFYPYLNTRRKQRAIEIFGKKVQRGESEEAYNILQPKVIEAYGYYMNKHRTQSDKKSRPSDNWQLGIPKDVYMKSAWRHFMDVWTEHRGLKNREILLDALMALLFNVMGYAHEILKENEKRRK